MPNYDYQLKPRTHGFDLWERVPPVTTPLGGYDCQLMVERNEKPDQGMIELAEVLVAFVTNQHEQIASILVAHYLRCADDFGEEYVFSDVLTAGINSPREATGDLLFQIYNGGRIGISKSVELDASVSFEVPFDPEHGLVLTYRDGAFTKLNDCGFSIVNERLYYEGEELPPAHSGNQRRLTKETSTSKAALVSEFKQRRVGTAKAKKFIFTREHQDFTEELQESLNVTIQEMKRDLERAWRTYKLPDVCRILLEHPDGWSIATLKHYTAKYAKEPDDRLAYAQASSFCALQMLARMIRDMERSLASRQWPPPPFEPPECAVLKDLRLELASLPQEQPLVLPRVEVTRPLSYEIEAEHQLNRRREANNYVSPTWSLKISSRLPEEKPSWRFVEYLATILKASKADALTAYHKLAAGESVQIPLGKRSDWWPIRHEFSKMNIQADISATY